MLVRLSVLTRAEALIMALAVLAHAPRSKEIQHFELERTSLVSGPKLQYQFCR